MRPPLATYSVDSKPEFAPLPNRGPDPVCGMSRSWWYNAENAGLIELKRIRLPGQVKGRTLLPVARAVELIERLSTKEKVFVAPNAT